MKRLLKMLILSVIIFVIMSNVTINVFADNGSFIVMDIDSGRVLYDENSRAKRPIASLTKILTCITAIENFDLKSTVEIEREWTGIEGSSIYLNEGERLTVEELLYGLMLRSGNDAATAICGYGNNTRKNFISLMNKTAYKIGAHDSSFENPHGLDSVKHFSTAYDLALISSYSMKNETFSRIVSTKKIEIGSDDNKRVLVNKNKLLTFYPYAKGIKTGYTKKSGRCLASAAQKNDMSLVCIVLNHASTYETTESLFEECFAEYKNVLLQAHDEPVAMYEKDGYALPCYIEQDAVYPLKDDETSSVNKKILLTYNGGYPIKSGTEMGVIEFYLENQLLFTRKIYNIMS